MVQETFLALTRAAKRYQPGAAKVSTYLYAIVRNLTRRRLRRERRAWSIRNWKTEPWARHEPITEQSLIDEATRQQTIERVRQAVLSPSGHAVRRRLRHDCRHRRVSRPPRCRT